MSHPSRVHPSIWVTKKGCPYLRGSVIKVWGVADARELASLQAEGNDRFASLTYAFSDARKVAAALKDPSKGNLPLDQVLLHGDDEATKNVIEADLRELARRMKAGDTLVFYFSGHGMPGSDGQAKLIPADAKPNDEETWLSVAERKDQDQKPSSCIFPLPASPSRLL